MYRPKRDGFTALLSADTVGVLCGLGAALIWGAWPVVSKFGVRETLSAYDIAALRFLVAGVLLTPIVVRHRKRVSNWPLAVGLACGAGAPYTLISVGGLGWAPASHGGIIGPSCSMLFSFLGGWLLLHDRPKGRRGLGVAIVATGVLLVGWSSFHAVDADHQRAWRGDLMFVAAGFLWAGYTVGVRRSGLAPLLATALVAVISMVVYLPLYAIFSGLPVLAAPPDEILLQGIFQGVLAAIVALLLHTAAVSRLGATRAAIFPGLAPGFAVVFSAVLLGEGLTVWEVAGVGIVSLGMLIALNVPLGLPKRRVPASAVLPRD